MQYTTNRFSAEKQNSQGFTLIEMLVTVAVFAITMAMVSAIFININNLQQQTANMAKLQNEGRYVLEKISKEIRGRELDYAASGIDQSTGMTQNLVFKKDEFGDIYTIRFSASSIIITIDNDAGLKEAPLNASDVTVDKLQFIVNPRTDPYEVLPAGETPQEQPRVTIMMVIKNGDAVPERFRKTLQLQTTISSKIYK